MQQALELGIATWRLSRMLVMEDGPLDCFVLLRMKSGIEYGPDGKAMSWPPWNPLHCVLCTSVYAAVLVVFMPRWMRAVLMASGLTVMLERMGPREVSRGK